jgi:hypothetical protein
MAAWIDDEIFQGLGSCPWHATEDAPPLSTLFGSDSPQSLFDPLELMSPAPSNTDPNVQALVAPQTDAVAALHSSVLNAPADPVMLHQAASSGGQGTRILVLSLTKVNKKPSPRGDIEHHFHVDYDSDSKKAPAQRLRGQVPVTKRREGITIVLIEGPSRALCDILKNPLSNLRVTSDAKFRKNPHGQALSMGERVTFQHLVFTVESAEADTGVFIDQTPRPGLGIDYSVITTNGRIIAQKSVVFQETPVTNTEHI